MAILWQAPQAASNNSDARSAMATLRRDFERLVALGTLIAWATKRDLFQSSGGFSSLLQITALSADQFTELSRNAAVACRTTDRDSNHALLNI